MLLMCVQSAGELLCVLLLLVLYLGCQVVVVLPRYSPLVVCRHCKVFANLCSSWAVIVVLPSSLVHDVGSSDTPKTLICVSFCLLTYALLLCSLWAVKSSTFLLASRVVMTGLNSRVQ